MSYSLDGLHWAEGYANPVVRHSALAGPVGSFGEVHFHYEHPFRYVYHTLRWLADSQDKEDIGVQVCAAPASFLAHEYTPAACVLTWLLPYLVVRAVVQCTAAPTSRALWYCGNAVLWYCGTVVCCSCRGCAGCHCRRGPRSRLPTPAPTLTDGRHCLAAARTRNALWLLGAECGDGGAAAAVQVRPRPLPE